MTSPALPYTHHSEVYAAQLCFIDEMFKLVRAASPSRLATLCWSACSGFACVPKRPLKVFPQISQGGTVHSTCAASESSMQVLHLHRKRGLLRRFESQHRAASTQEQHPLRVHHSKAFRHSRACLTSSGLQAPYKAYAPCLSNVAAVSSG